MSNEALNLLGRAAVCLTALGWALASVHRSGNYRAIRRYLWMMVADVLIGGVYLFFWPLEAWAWVGIYAALTAAIASVAALVAWQAIGELPGNYRAYLLGVSLTACTIAIGLQWPVVDDPGLRVTLVSAGLMFAIGIVTICGSLVADVTHSHSYRTLGLLWAAQGFMLFIHASGAQAYPQVWKGFGEWLPAVVFSIGMIFLGRDFQNTQTLSEQTN